MTECQICGGDLQDSYVRCPYCGVSIPRRTPIIAGTSVAPKNTKRRKTRFYVLISLLSVLIVGGVVAVLLFSSNISSSPGFLSKPSIQEPLPGQKVQAFPLELKWNAVQQATNYRIQVSLSDNFPESASIINESTKDPIYSIRTGILQPNTTYYWRIRAGTTEVGVAPSDWEVGWFQTQS